MRKLGFLAVLGVFLLLLMAVPSLPAASYSFAVMGDHRASGNKPTHDPTSVNSQAVRAITEDIVAKRNSSLLLTVGDYTYGESTSWYGYVAGDPATYPPALPTGFGNFKTIMQEGGGYLAGSGETGSIPYYPVRGNHELYNTVYGTDLTNAWRNAFGQYLPQNGPASEKGMTYSFTANGNQALFLGLDEYPNAPADTAHPVC